MAIDFQVAFPQEAIHLNRVRILRGPPRTLSIVGNDFRAVDEVLVNGLKSPDSIIISKTKLLAQVPDELLDQNILSVSVFSRRLTITPKSFIRFRISKTPGKVTGIMRLMQKYLKILFTSQGTDIFNMQLGASALRDIGSTFTGDGTQIVQNLVIAADTATKQMIALQARDPSIPADERLLSATVTKSGFNKEEGTVNVEIELINQSGQPAITNLEL